MSGRRSREKWLRYQQKDNNWCRWQPCLRYWTLPKLNSGNWRSGILIWRKVNWRSGRRKWSSRLRKWSSEKKVLPPKWKWHRLQNHPTINYNVGRSNRRSMEWNNLIVGSHELHNAAKAYSNVVSSITNFVEPTTQTKIITNKTILTQYIIKQGFKVFGQKAKAAVQK